MGMMINRRRVCGGKSLPYDAKIEYLQGDGASYILTNVNLTNNTGVITEIKYCILTETRNETWVMGSWTKEKRPYLIGYYRGYYRIVAGPDNSTYWGIIAWDDKFHTARVDTSGAYFDGVKKASTALDDVMNITNIPLFKSYHVNEVVAKQIAYCKIWNLNGALIRDFIPVRIGTTGYLYDKVSKQFFGNSGTGNFILGPDK